MDESTLSKNSVAQLKEMLRANGLPVSGNKSALIGRLMESKGKDEVWDELTNVTASIDQANIANLSLEEDAEGALTFKQRMSTTVFGPINLGALIAIGMALIMVTATILIVKPASVSYTHLRAHET